MLESSTNYVYKSLTVSADDNPHILSGNIAHGRVALLWKRTIDDFVTPLENIRDVSRSGRCPNAIVHNKREDSDLLRSFNLNKKLS